MVLPLSVNGELFARVKGDRDARVDAAKVDAASDQTCDLMNRVRPDVTSAVDWALRSSN